MSLTVGLPSEARCLSAISNKSDLIATYFNVIAKHVFKYHNPITDSDHDSLHEIVHKVLASRTQTFDRESIDIILAVLKTPDINTEEYTYLPKEFERSVHINLSSSNPSKILAQTVTNFYIGDGTNIAPIGYVIGSIKITRSMYFDINNQTWSDENFLVEPTI